MNFSNLKFVLFYPINGHLNEMDAHLFEGLIDIEDANVCLNLLEDNIRNFLIIKKI